MSVYQRNRVDGNQAAVDVALRCVGAVVIPTTGDPKIGFDRLVAFRGELYVIEVKNGNHPPSKRQLTPGEQLRKAELESVGVKYHVVSSAEEALEVIGVLYGLHPC